MILMPPLCDVDVSTLARMVEILHRAIETTTLPGVTRRSGC